MKTLILIEGANDSIFLKEIITKTTLIGIRPFFYSNYGKKSAKDDQETVKLRNFCLDSSYHTLFVKEEGGHDFVISLFINVVVNFLLRNHDLCLTVLFDHDSRDPDTEIQKINLDLKARTSGKIGFDHMLSKKKIVDGFYRRDFSLIQYGGQKMNPPPSFSFATFDNSLEQVVSNHCSKPEKYLEEDNFKEFGSTIDLQDLINCNED